MTISTGPMLRARPFGNSSWFLQVRVAETSLSEKKKQSKRSKGSKEKLQKSKSSSSSGTLELSEIQELLQRMALDLGALPSEDALGEEREMLEFGALESGHSQGFGLWSSSIRSGDLWWLILFVMLKCYDIICYMIFNPWVEWDYENIIILQYVEYHYNIMQYLFPIHILSTHRNAMDILWLDDPSLHSEPYVATKNDPTKKGACPRWTPWFDTCRWESLLLCLLADRYNIKNKW